MIAPIADDIVSRISEKALKLICIVLMAVFLFDAGYSQLHPNAGKGVTDIQAREAADEPVHSVLKDAAESVTRGI